jgi:MtN3 and saliva related transmembrane protein
MDLLSIIGYLAGIFTTIAVVPQIYKAVKTNKVDDISPVFFSILLLGVGLWTVYGILKTDWPIILTNGISFFLNATMLGIYLKNKLKK